MGTSASAAPLLAIIAGQETDALIELRSAVSGPWGKGMAQEFHPTTEQGLHTATNVIGHLGQRTDLFVGAVPRTERGGGKSSVRRAWALWVDCDSPDAVGRLAEFEHQPTLTVRSGSPGNLHAWWALTGPVPASVAEMGNRRLASRLGADMRATDAARIMRPPGTLNWKHKPPAAVEVAEFDCLCYYGLAELVSDIPDPRPPKPPAAPRPVDRGDDLATVPVEHYYTALTGRDALRGNCPCPFHGEDRNPSLRLYPATNTWYCFACNKGGSVYEFGAALWGMGTRGEDFKRLRERLCQELGVN